MTSFLVVASFIMFFGLLAAIGVLIDRIEKLTAETRRIADNMDASVAPPADDPRGGSRVVNFPRAG